MNTANKNKVLLTEKIFAHIQTWRPYTVIWCGLVSLAGSCIAYGDFPGIKTGFLVFIIPIMGWIAGLYLSDYLDRKLDKIEKPHRPIPSGKIKPIEALVAGGIFAFIGFILSFLLTINNIILVFIVAALVFSYAKISKSKGIIGNINRGTIIIAAYFYGVLGTGLFPRFFPLYIWFLPVVFLIHDTNSNLVGAIRDKKGDEKGGYQTIPVKYGIKKSLMISLILSKTYFLLTFALVIYFDFIVYNLRFYVFFLLAIIILSFMYFTMFRAGDKIDRKKALHAHEFFVGERIVFASAFCFGMINNIWVSFFIFIFTISITLISQYLIRDRYEFKV